MKGSEDKGDGGHWRWQWGRGGGKAGHSVQRGRVHVWLRDGKRLGDVRWQAHHGTRGPGGLHVKRGGRAIGKNAREHSREHGKEGGRAAAEKRQAKKAAVMRKVAAMQAAKAAKAACPGQAGLWRSEERGVRLWASEVVGRPGRVPPSPLVSMAFRFRIGRLGPRLRDERFGMRFGQGGLAASTSSKLAQGSGQWPQRNPQAALGGRPLSSCRAEDAPRNASAHTHKHSEASRPPCGAPRTRTTARTNIPRHPGRLVVCPEREPRPENGAPQQ